MPLLESYAPGRAELLGNHTDYNEGVVLSIAVDRGVRLTGRVRDGGGLRFHARDIFRIYEGSLERLVPSEDQPWANYLLGVLDEFRRRGLALGGLDVAIQSDLPYGAGLSSSAALEMAAALFLQRAFGHSLDRMELARIGQAAEHRYVGVRCGLLDQVSSLFGRAGHVVFLDCRSLEVRTLPLPPGLSFVIANSGMKHALVSGEYNERRESCEAAARVLGVRALRDVDAATLDARARELPPLPLARARHIVGENARVAAAAAALGRGDAAALGAAMFASHESSVRNFENSCPELDRLVAAARAVPGCLGARLSGGGFGGATINLVRTGAEQALIAALEAAVPGTTCLVTTAADGARAA